MIEQKQNINVSIRTCTQITQNKHYKYIHVTNKYNQLSILNIVY